MTLVLLCVQLPRVRESGAGGRGDMQLMPRRLPLMTGPVHKSQLHGTLTLEECPEWKT